MALLLPGQGRRYVALGVPGGHQHQRHGGEPAHTALHQLRDRVAQGRRGQLDEAARDGQFGMASAQFAHEVAERLGSGLVPGAVSGDEQGGRGRHRFSSGFSDADVPDPEVREAGAGERRVAGSSCQR